jgi:outer membrane receptor protein involved in Fe transport
LNVVYRFNTGTEIRAAWGETYQAQNVNDLQVEDGITSFTGPEQVTQTVLGFIQPLPADLTFRLDVYQKQYHDLRPRYENALDPLEAIPEADWDRIRIDAPRARAKGVEMTLRRDVPGSWGGFISYAYSKAEELENNVWRPRSWDQQHNVSSGFHAAIGKWTLSMAALYHSGAPTTQINTSVITLPNGSRQAVIYPGDRNEARLGPFTRIDMRIGRESRLRRGVISYYLEIINLLGQKNDYCFELSDYRVVNDNGVPRLDSKTKYGLPLLPSLGFQYEF